MMTTLLTLMSSMQGCSSSSGDVLNLGPGDHRDELQKEKEAEQNDKMRNRSKGKSKAVRIARPVTR